MAKVKTYYRSKVVAKTTGEKVFLQALDGEHWIITKKLDVEAFDEILEMSGTRVTPEQIQEKAAEEGVDYDKLSAEEIQEKNTEIVRKLVTEEVEKAGAAGEKTLRRNLSGAMKVAFLHGVYDHNFMEPVWLLDDQGNKKREGEYYLAEENPDGTAKMQKVAWDENLWEELKGYNQLIVEIFQAVMAFNKAIKKKK